MIQGQKASKRKQTDLDMSKGPCGMIADIPALSLARVHHIILLHLHFELCHKVVLPLLPKPYSDFSTRSNLWRN